MRENWLLIPIKKWDFKTYACKKFRRKKRTLNFRQIFGNVSQMVRAFKTKHCHIGGLRLTKDDACCDFGRANSTGARLKRRRFIHKLPTPLPSSLPSSVVKETLILRVSAPTLNEIPTETV